MADIRWKWLEERGIDVDPFQQFYMKQLWNPSIQAIFCEGKAGTGKTTLAILAAAYEVHNQEKDRIIYIRSTQTVGKELGFLEGSLEKKQAPYMQPLIDAMELIQPDAYKKWSEKEKVIATTPTYLRGTNFNNSYIILDEAQNYSLIEIQTVLTRIKDNCKVAVVGSLAQNDSKNQIKGKTPFEWYIKHFEHEQYVVKCNLIKNYRGKFADKADDIQLTINKVG